MENLNYEEPHQIFSRYGFLESPLSESEFIKVVKSGLHEHAYTIGCDLFSGAFDSIDQAIDYYKRA